MKQSTCLASILVTAARLAKHKGAGLTPTLGSGMSMWREKLLAQMHLNASAAAGYLKLPSNALAELGSKIEI